jgi:hypothetical protein
MNEIWKDIDGYNGIYQVSSFGRIKSFKCKKETILNGSDGGHGYLKVTLNKKSLVVHQLVAIAFLNHKPCGFNLVVNHKDFNRQNNNVNNLEIITQRENANRKHIPSSSKYVGVSYRKPYKSQIKIKGKNILIGYYETEIEAHNAYQNKLKQIKNPS